MCYHKCTGMYGKGHSKFSNIVPLIIPLLFPPSNNKNMFMHPNQCCNRTVNVISACLHTNPD